MAYRVAFFFPLILACVEILALIKYYNNTKQYQMVKYIRTIFSLKSNITFNFGLGFSAIFTVRDFS